jgi:hypothetical protein
VCVTSNHGLGDVLFVPRNRGRRSGDRARGRVGERRRRSGTVVRACLDNVGHGGKRRRAQDDSQDKRSHGTDEYRTARTPTRIRFPDFGVSREFLPLRDIGHESIVENQIQSAPYDPSTSGQFIWKITQSLIIRVQARRILALVGLLRDSDDLRRRRDRFDESIVNVTASAKCFVALAWSTRKTHDVDAPVAKSVTVVNGLCQRRTLCASQLNETRRMKHFSCAPSSGSLSAVRGLTAARPNSFWTWTITQGHAGGPPQRVLRSALA